MAIVGYQPYESYKDSGVNWIGNVPSQWLVTRLGTVFDERRTKVSDKDYEPLSVTKNGIFRQLDSAAKTNDGDNRKLVRQGDFVINSRSDRKSSSGVSPLDGSVSLINIVLQPKGIHPTFCNYLLKSYGFVEEFYRMGHGIVADLWTTRYDEMRAILLALPPSNEQLAISEFLEDKCAGIDEAVFIKEQEIDLLRERRQILIQEAVTRGLNPDARMKESGVDWVGRIPAHWDLLKIRNLFVFKKGLTITKENLQDEGVPCVNYGEIHSKFPFEVDPAHHQLRCVDISYLKNNQASLLSHGDFVFADTSEDIDGSGNFTYFNSADTAFAGYHTLIAKPKVPMASRFMAYLFDSQAFRSQVQTAVKGVKVFSITQSILKATSAWLPPFSEQLAIVEFLDSECKKVDDFLIIKHDQITALKEYKTSLINSAVTGKIKII
jgi:type I restriction enzyme S subunit